LQTRQKDLTLTSNLYENLTYLYRTLGLHPHPCLNTIPKPNPPLKPVEQPKDPNASMKVDPKSNKSPLKGKKAEEELIVEHAPPFLVKNSKIDIVLLKLLNFCWSHSKTNALILIKNEFEDDIENNLIQIISNPSFLVNKLSIEWNFPINMQLYVTILNNPNIEYLSLRSNEIDDEKLAVLCETLQTNTTLRFLELCDNKITKEGINHLVPLLRSSSALEYVGLGRNQIKTWEDISEWFNGIGRFVLTPEELEQYREKEREREAAILKNNKNKGKKGYVNEPVEYLDPVVQNEDQSWVMVKGGKLKIINLALDGFGDEYIDQFSEFLARQAPEFRLILAGTKITKDGTIKLLKLHDPKIVFK